MTKDKIEKLYKVWWISRNGCNKSLKGKPCKHCDEVWKYDYEDIEVLLLKIAGFEKEKTFGIIRGFSSDVDADLFDDIY